MSVLALAMIALATSASAAELSPEPSGFQSRLTPDKVQLGEPFTYELVVTHPKGLRYELRSPADLGAFEVLEQQRSRIDAGQSATTTFKVQLASFELGKQRLPDLTFEVIGEEGAGHWVAPGRELEVVSALPEDADQKGVDLIDIHPPEDVPIRSWTVLYVLGGLLLAAAAGYLLFRLLKAPRATPAIPVKPLEPAHVRARRALDQLRALNLPAQGQYKELYFRLSQILRAYLGEVYAFDASESTTHELLEALRRLHTPGLPFERLAGFCSEADMVKFAKATVDPDACKAAIEFGYQLVEATASLIPPPVSPPADARPHLP